MPAGLRKGTGDTQPVIYDNGDGSSYSVAYLVSGQTISSTPTSSGALTDRSGTITTGGTSQQMMAANGTRSYLLISNNAPPNLEALWINFGTAALISSPSICLPTGTTMEWSVGLIPN